MKKKYIQLGAAVLALGIIIAALLYLQSAPPPEEEGGSASSAAEPVTYIIGGENSPLPESVELTVNLDGKSYPLSFVRNAEGKLAIPAWEGYELDSNIVASLNNNTQRLASKRLVVENPSREDLATYGLDSPRGIARVENSVVLFGAEAPGSEGCYAMPEGGNAVYLVATPDARPFVSPPTDYISKNVTPAPDAEFAGYRQIILSGEHFPEDIVIERATGEDTAQMMSATHMLTAPVQTRLSLGNEGEQLNTVFGLAAVSVEAAGGEPDLAQYGLDSPDAIAKVTCDTPELSFELSVSAPGEDGSRYLMKDRVPVIYNITSDQVPWAALSTFELMDKFAHMVNIGDVSNVKVTTPNGVYSFDVVQTVKDAENNTKEQTVTLDGAEVNIKDFRQFYQTVIGATYEEKMTAEQTAYIPAPLGEPVVRYDYTLEDGSDGGYVEFHKIAIPRRYLITVNGRHSSAAEGHYDFLTTEQYVNRVIEDAEKLKNGEEVKAYL